MLLLSWETTSAATATAGVPFDVTVTAYDAYGNVASGYLGTVIFGSTDPAAVLPADYQFHAKDAGAQTFSVTLFMATTVNPTHIWAVDQFDAVNAGADDQVTVSAGPAVRLELTTGLGPVTLGVPFDVTVTAYDSYGNVASGYTGTVAFASSDAAAVLPVDYQFQAIDAGAHTFPVTLGTAYAYESVTATDTANALLTGQIYAVAVMPGSSSTATVLSPSSVVVGGSVTDTITISTTGTGVLPPAGGSGHC